MKIILILAIFVISLASAARLRTNTDSASTVTKVENLSFGVGYGIRNQKWQKYYGKDHLGWVLSTQAKIWFVYKSGDKYRLKHANGYLKVGFSYKSFQSAPYDLILTNSGNGICISGGQRYLRMYYHYVFPFGQYKTNLVDGCGSWERFEFRKYGQIP